MEMEGWGKGTEPLKIFSPNNISKRFLILEGVDGAPPNMHQQISRSIKDEKTGRGVKRYSLNFEGFHKTVYLHGFQKTVYLKSKGFHKIIYL